MRVLRVFRIAAPLRRRGASVRISSAVMLFQRSPLVNLLPEARVIATSGFAEALKWVVTAVAGLGAYDSVSGASGVSQVLPSPNSSTVNTVAGDSLNFIFQCTGTETVPASFQITGTLPPGLSQTGLQNSTIDSVTGTPTQAGSWAVTAIAWEFPGFTGESLRKTFTINISNPPLPAITSPPTGGIFNAGEFVSLAVGHTNGKTFTWKRNGADLLPPAEHILVGLTSPRRFLVAPTTDPGAAWRTDPAFADSSWSIVSGGIGYDTVTNTGVNFLPHIAAGGNVQLQMSGSGKPTSAYLRLPFTLTAPAALSFLKLRVQSDDGFVAWLNGTEVAFQNRPSTFQWNSAASANADDNTAITFREIRIPQHLGLLHTGENLLAVQALNQSATSPDFLFNCELVSGIDAINSSRLLLTSLRTEDTGSYTVTVANPAGSVTSNPSPVLIRPSIIAQPASVTIGSGTSTQLNVTPGGTPPFNYQWYRGVSGDSSNPLPGATGQSFMTPILTETTGYWVRVTTEAGTVDSVTATVTVNTTVDPYSAWKAAQFSAADGMNAAVSGPDADPDRDGIPNSREYVYGTPPMQAEPAPVLRARLTGGQVELRIFGHRTAGPGYGGLTRRYTIESSGDVSAGSWGALAAANGVAGADADITALVTTVPDRNFFRVIISVSP